MNAAAAAAPRRVGVFGGAFDPPHRGHGALVEQALRQLALTRLHVVPTGQAWHKARALTPGAHRLAMCCLAFAEGPAVQIDERELRRSGPSYTVDTLTELRTLYPDAELILLMGADQWAALPSWHRWRDVLALATPVVAHRPGAPQPAALHGVAPHLLPWAALDLSSTAVRAAAAAGAGVAELARLVPLAVARYIVDHGLYRSAGQP
ncbi:MAG: nicotinate (nicotinamide) nucleotide adenylyltransferase [Tepidimonas sp.]|nr:nicotinate (nicotinamide) nucleotide adenylyltransferase [Tepidimonas sp.]